MEQCFVPRNSRTTVEHDIVRLSDDNQWFIQVLFFAIFGLEWEISEWRGGSCITWYCWSDFRRGLSKRWGVVDLGPQHYLFNFEIPVT